MSTPTASPVFGATIAANFSTFLNGLATAAACQANAIDLSALPSLSGLSGSTIPANTIPDDVLLDFLVTTASGTLGTNPAVAWYVAALVQGSTFPAGATGTAGAYTVPAVGGLSPIKTQGINAAATADAEGPVSLLTIFGFVPKKIVIIASNQTGLALGSSGNGVNVTPVYLQYPGY